MKNNCGFLLLLFTISAKAFPLSEGDSTKDFENSEITIKQVHLKPNQTLEVLLEIQSKTSEQDKDGDKIGSVAGQILNEFYEQKKHSPGESEEISGTKQKYVVPKKPVAAFAKPGSEDDEAEAPVKIQTQNLVQIGSDTEVDIYEEVPRPERQRPAVEPANIPTNVENHAIIEPVKSNAELISNIVANVNADKPRGWNKTVVYQEPYQYQPVQSQQNENTFDNQPAPNFENQPQSVSFSNIASPNTNNNLLEKVASLEGQNQIVPISNIISLPAEVTQPPTTAIPVVPTTVATDDDEDDDEDEDEDANRVARTK